MKIIEPYAKMLRPPDSITDEDYFTQMDGLALLKHVEWCSRISHRSEDKVTEDSWKRIIQNVVIEHGDWSVTEHAVVSVDAYVDRGITHEWVRHRIGAYTQESTRFVNYKNKMGPSFIYPIGMTGLPAVLTSSDNKGNAALAWHQCIDACEKAYKMILNAGYPPQIARSVFPNALASRLIVTYNLRNWRHFFIMRTTQESHPQMKQVTIPLLAEFKEKIPLLYDDIEPNMKQSESMKKAR
jgi:thymidylate synthase (FAD)